MLKSLSYVFSITHPGTSEAPTAMILPGVNGIQLSLMSSSAQVAHRQMARPLSKCEYSIPSSKLGRHGCLNIAHGFAATMSTCDRS
jgi:hypothetical protein